MCRKYPELRRNYSLVAASPQELAEQSFGFAVTVSARRVEKANAPLRPTPRPARAANQRVPNALIMPSTQIQSAQSAGQRFQVRSQSSFPACALPKVLVAVSCRCDDCARYRKLPYLHYAAQCTAFCSEAFSER